MVPEVKFKEIAKLENPIQTIVSMIQNEIESGKYQLIVGEDASGRIPALIFWNIISTSFRNFGFQTPKLIFYAGGTPHFDSDKKERELVKFFRRFKKQPKTHALLVTEFISSGSSIKMGGDALAGAEINFDIAAVGSKIDHFGAYFFKTRSAPKIFQGAEHCPSIYGSKLGGTEKLRENIFSTRKENQENNRSAVRNDIKIVSKNIFEKTMLKSKAVAN